jgi:F-type H+-transporting ATPase subunit a
MTRSLPAANISVGDHPHFKLFGLTFDTDTIIMTVIASAIVIILGLLMTRRAHHGVPNKLQLFFEFVVDYIESQVSPDLKVKAPFVVPLAVTIFIFLLACNWLGILSNGHEKELLPAPASDVNLTYALGLFVIVTVWVKAIRVRGARKYLSHFKEPYIFLLPVNIIEEIIKPFTLALRLFGNIFAGGVMVLIISLLPVFVLWLPNVIWKLFDLFVGGIQAFIFALLTIIYFMTAVAPEEDH